MSGTTRYSLARAAPAPRHAPACCSALLTPHHALDTQQMRCQCPAHRSARACACARQSAHRRKFPKLGACTLRWLAQSILGVRPIFLDEKNRREPPSKRSAVTQPATQPVSSSPKQLLKLGLYPELVDQGKARQGFTITYCRGFTYGSVRDVIDDCAIIAVTLRVYRFSVAKFVKARRPPKFQSSSSKLT